MYVKRLCIVGLSKICSNVLEVIYLLCIYYITITEYLRYITNVLEVNFFFVLTGIIFEKYPIDVAAEEREETVWRAICKRIDAKCRGTIFFSKF